MENIFKKDLSGALVSPYWKALLDSTGLYFF